MNILAALAGVIIAFYLWSNRKDLGVIFLIQTELIKYYVILPMLFKIYGDPVFSIRIEEIRITKMEGTKKMEVKK